MRTSEAAAPEVSRDTSREAFEATPGAPVFTSIEWDEVFGRTFGPRHRCIGFHDETGFGMAHLGPGRSGGVTGLSASSPVVLLSAPARVDQLVGIPTVLPGIDAVVFEQAPEGGQVCGAARRWPAPVTPIPASVWPQIDAATFEDLNPEKVRHSTSVTQDHRLVLPMPGSVRGPAFAGCGVLRQALARSGAAQWGRGVRDGVRRLAGTVTASFLRPGRPRW